MTQKSLIRENEIIEYIESLECGIYRIKVSQSGAEFLEKLESYNDLDLSIISNLVWISDDYSLFEINREKLLKLAESEKIVVNLDLVKHTIEFICTRNYRENKRRQQKDWSRDYFKYIKDKIRLLAEEIALDLDARLLRLDKELKHSGKILVIGDNICDSRYSLYEKRNFFILEGDGCYIKNRIKGKFEINKYIILRLEDDRTNIYINGEIFSQCKQLLLNFEMDESLNQIKSIDEAIEYSKYIPSIQLDPMEEFIAHCSNIQVWVENDYDTRLLHSNLAFPLLRKLVSLGDPVAKRRFKEEIAFRVKERYTPVVIYLYSEGYFDYFTEDEKKMVLEDSGFTIEILDELLKDN